MVAAHVIHTRNKQLFVFKQLTNGVAHELEVEAKDPSSDSKDSATKPGTHWNYERLLRPLGIVVALVGVGVAIWKSESK